MATVAETELSVAVEKKPGSQVEITIEAPASDVDKAIDAALRRLARQIRIPGFRPGKAPVAIVERTVGWESVQREAFEELVPVVYLRAIDEAKVEPVSDPSVDLKVAQIERGQGVRFVATVTVKPDVQLGDYAAVRVPEPTTEVSEAQVDEILDNVRKAHSKLEEVDRAAQLGDVLRCSLTMRSGDEVLSGEEGDERDLELDPERLLPGIAPGCVGMKAGEQKSFDITLPEDFQREDLRGKTVTVGASVHAVRERVLPPVDDELAKLDGHGATADEMRKHYHDNLVIKAEREMTEQFENDVLSALRDAAVIDVPEVMVNSEIERQLSELEQRFSNMGISWEQYLQYSGETIEKLRGERRESAAQRVKLELALDAFAEAEGLEVDESAVEREEKRMTAGMKLNAQQKRRAHAITHTDLRRQGAVTRMLEIARGEG